MKATKTLLAASVLAIAAGGAQAATVGTFSVALNAVSIMQHNAPVCDTSGTTPVCTPAPDTDILAVNPLNGGTGTAVLDDSGTLTITGDLRKITTYTTDNTLSFVFTFHGTWDGTTFAANATNATYLLTNCTNNNPAIPTCDPTQIGVEWPSGAGLDPDTGLPKIVITSGGTVTLAGGTLTSSVCKSTSCQNDSYVLTAVPVPAAAWLFGSGLLGLAGTARRRRTA